MPKNIFWTYYIQYIQPIIIRHHTSHTGGARRWQLRVRAKRVAPATLWIIDAVDFREAYKHMKRSGSAYTAAVVVSSIIRGFWYAVVSAAGGLDPTYDARAVHTAT